MIDTSEIRKLFHDGSDALIFSLCDEIDRLRGAKQSPPQGKTVEVAVEVAVKVAVCVDKDGNWQAGGGSWYSRKGSVDSAADGLVSGESLYWLTATLPVPAEVCVVAKVEGE